MKFKRLLSGLYTATIPVTYRDIYGGLHTSQELLRIDARTKGRVRVDRASFGTWEEIDESWLGVPTIVAARKVAASWAIRANAQATLTPRGESHEPGRSF